MLTNPLTSDLEHILHYTLPLWEEWRDQQIFISGGTGFFGSWLLEAFAWANTKLNLNAQCLVLTRHPQVFAKKCPHLASYSGIQFLEGDVRTFEFPQGHFSHVIHAATEASATLNETNPALMAETIIEGTRRMLEFAKICQAKSFLLVSSGAVYGVQPPEISHIAEDYPCQPKLEESAYAYGKYRAEQLCLTYAAQNKIELKIARCFAFVGPYLPLDIHYAIGNFIRDGLRGGPIRVKGDGTPCRSYLYAADLVIWLMTILMRGQSCNTYNVGSDEAMSIAEVAHLVANCFERPLEVNVLQKKSSSNVLPARYVPAIIRARDELNLIPRIRLADAIRSTIRWYS